MSSNSELATPPAAIPRWLSIVGIGEDGADGLSAAARELIQSADIVFGGARHLSLAASLIRGTTRAWLRPFERNVAEVLALRGQAVCLLASGDPFLHGVGNLLAGHVAAEETTVVPAPSAFSLAASRLLWPLAQVTQISLCGRPLELLRPHLHPGARLLALTSDEHSPAAIAKLLVEAGCGDSRCIVLEALAGPRERIRSVRASDFNLDDIDRLNTVAIEVVAGPQARVLSHSSGLADALFEHDGQLTKHEVRALTLSALAPEHGELLWDVGAGSGSVSIEWLLADPSLTAIAIEHRADRVARIRRNASAFGVPHLQLIEGSAPDAIAGLPAPNAIFIGGGATAPGLIDAAQTALLSKGRLVVNSVTLETEAILLERYARFGGTLTRIDIAHADGIGGEHARLSGWRAAMPIVQWRWVKP
ncbi:MAG: precorrin-6y C5,15-methyltransferase (decarboxylating) subunit CbiE [Steroidobacteraceae bacterium]